jgi:hypothetical protein
MEAAGIGVLPSLGWRRLGGLRPSVNVIHLESGIKVDLFIRGDAPFDLEEFRRHRRELIRRDPERYVYVKTTGSIWRAGVASLRSTTCSTQFRLLDLLQIAAA